MAKQSTALTVRCEQLPARVLLQTYLKDRKSILDFVNRKLVAGVDFGHTAFAKDGSPQGKPTLKKPGAEKLCIYLRLDPVFIPDRETREFLGATSGTVCYLCFLVPRHLKAEILRQLKALGKDNELAIYRALSVAEGRGGYTIAQTFKGEERINTVIKMAEKSAQIDAVLRVQGLSEMFTQDMENAVQGEARPVREEAPARQPEPLAGGSPLAQIEELLAKLPLKQTAKNEYLSKAKAFASARDSKNLQGILQSLNRQHAYWSKKGESK